MGRMRNVYKILIGKPEWKSEWLLASQEGLCCTEFLSLLGYPLILLSTGTVILVKFIEKYLCTYYY
jgi:hypothetical protein